MGRISFSKGVALFSIYLGGLFVALVVLLGDKDAEVDAKFHAYQSLVFVVLNVFCGLGSILAIVFAIIALIKNDAPTLPLIGDKCREWAAK